MDVAIHESYEALSRWAAQAVVAELRAKPDALCCLATGQTPLRTYELLAEQGQRTPDVFRHMRMVKLDEWLGLPMDAPQTCETALRQQILEPLGVTPDRYLAFHSLPDDPDAHCRVIARQLDAQGPIDVCLLGLGRNGHLGFIEPAPALALHAHVSVLHPASQGHAMVKGLVVPPDRGLTLGIRDILQARKVLLLVNGAHKRDPLQTLLTQRIRTDFPASLLWLHPNAILACDAAAVGPVR